MLFNIANAPLQQHILCFIRVCLFCILADEHSGRCGNSHDSPSHLLRESSFDVIVSNCALNLSLDKAAVLDNAYALLKPGGLCAELKFSCKAIS